jgi:hypothetical protein
MADELVELPSLRDVRPLREIACQGLGPSHRRRDRGKVRIALTEGSRTSAGPESRPPVRHIFDRSRDDVSLFECQRLPCGDWLLEGASGFFTIEVEPDAQQRARPSLLAEPYIEEPITQAAVWKCPAPALAEDAPSREWLEAPFGHLSATPRG